MQKVRFVELHFDKLMKFPWKDAARFPRGFGDSWCDEMYRIAQFVIFYPL